MPVLLNYLSDVKEHTDREITREMADYFGLSREERARFLPNSDRKVFVDRIAWAKAELGMAGLIAIPRRGVAVITERGLNVLQQGPLSMDRNFLKQFPDYREKVEGIGEGQTSFESVWDTEQYPREVLEGAYQRLRRELAAELLTRIKAGSSNLYQRLIIDLLVAMGYSGTLRDAVRFLGTTGDQGVEGTVRADSLGTERIHVRASRGNEPISRQEILSFARAMEAKRAWRGVFMTTSSFSDVARGYAASIERSIVLISGEELAGLMIDYDVGVNTTGTYAVKSIDNDAFRED
jgi:restriction system protein